LTHEQNQQDRQLQLERLFHRNYSDLIDLASEDRRLLVADADNIVQALAARLAEYDGDPEDEPFLTWAGSVIRPTVSRISKFYQLLEEHSGAIRGGIWAALPRSNRFDDNSALAQEAAQEVAMLVLTNLDDLLEPGPAKLSVRLFALARRHTLDYYTKKARRRLNAVQRRLSQGSSFNLPEVLSAQELASMRAEEHQEMAS
jgi:hypothetical protein